MGNFPKEKEYDVIIVGSGPAGSACAKALFKCGLNVVMLEKRKLPRYKCCAGILAGETQALVKEYFGELPPDEMYCNPKVIHSDHIYGHDEQGNIFKFLWEWPKEGKEYSKDYLNLWRHKFDYWLAKKSNCEIADRCIFQQFSNDGRHLLVTVSSQQETRHLRTKYLVGADGSGSRVRGVLDPGFKKTYNTFVAYQRYYEFKGMRLEKDHWHIFRNPAFSAAIAEGMVKDNVMRISTMALKGQEPKVFMEKFVAFLAENYGVVLKRLVRIEGCMVTDMFATGNFHLGKGAVLLAGDAAGLMSMNGGGIDTALASGYQAGLAVKEALDSGKSAHQVYFERTDEIRKHINECARHLQVLPQPGATHG